MTNLLSKLVLLLETKFPSRGFLPHFHLHPAPPLPLFSHLPPTSQNQAKMEAQQLFKTGILSPVFGDTKWT